MTASLFANRAARGQGVPYSEPFWQNSVTMPGSGRVMTAMKETTLGCLQEGQGRRSGTPKSASSRAWSNPCGLHLASLQHPACQAHGLHSAHGRLPRLGLPSSRGRGPHCGAGPQCRLMLRCTAGQPGRTRGTHWLGRTSAWPSGRPLGEAWGPAPLSPPGPASAVQQTPAGGRGEEIGCGGTVAGAATQVHCNSPLTACEGRAL